MDKKYLTVYGGGILDDDEQKPMVGHHKIVYLTVF